MRSGKNGRFFGDALGLRSGGGRGSDRFEMVDGRGKTLHGSQDENFVYRNGYAFPKKWSGSNYRTREEAPYAYGLHVILGPIEVFDGEGYDAVYDDRLRQWYGERWESLQASAVESLQGRWS